ncbi:MAG TPA: DedA family protein [bacterium]|nr:MAG: Inner membrane protein YabI [Parcubacteria group bacterium ADurb.Bin192]HPN14794.1 DedA family protein [bacterium]
MHSFDYLLEYANQYQAWGYWLILIFSCLESLAVVGMLVPGTTITIVLGLLASEGLFDIKLLIFLSFIGAVLGDVFSYWLGLRGLRYFKYEEKIFELAHLDLAKKFFNKHGGKSVFFGRFIGPLRPLIPFVAGLSRMPIKAFFFWNVTSAFLWGVFYVLLGYFFGHAWKVLGAWPGRVGAMLLIFVGAVLVFYFRRAVLKKKVGSETYENRH